MMAMDHDKFNHICLSIAMVSKAFLFYNNHEVYKVEAIPLEKWINFNEMNFILNTNDALDHV